MRRSSRWCVVLAVAAATVDVLLNAQEVAERSGSYIFREGRAETAAITLTEADGAAGIAWPDSGDSRWDTALLEVDVQADAANTSPYVEISAGSFHDCARLEDRTVWCWGWNAYGQLGDGTIEDPVGAVQARLCD